MILKELQAVLWDKSLLMKSSVPFMTECLRLTILKMSKQKLQRRMRLQVL